MAHVILEGRTILKHPRSSPGKSRFVAAAALAIAADILQVVIFPLFITGAESPVDDVLDLGLAGILLYLLGWQWEFLPSFVGKLVPGVDLVPFWTLAVVNVYRKSRRNPPAVEAGPIIEGVRTPSPAAKDSSET
jgi:hypothetical protein